MSVHAARWLPALESDGSRSIAPATAANGQVAGADDLAALTAHLDLKNAVHVGHSTGGGEVVHYIARHGESRVAKAAIISAVPPLMVKTAANPGGLPKEVFDGLQAQLAANRAQFYYDLPAGPFYGYNRPGAKPSQGTIWNWWRQGMMGGARAHYDGIVAFSQTDFTEDLKKITVPVLVMHGDDDQIVPYAELGAAVGEAAEERHPENLQGLSARHANHRGRDHQRRPARLHPRVAPAVFTLPQPYNRKELRHASRQAQRKRTADARQLRRHADRSPAADAVRRRQLRPPVDHQQRRRARRRRRGSSTCRSCCRRSRPRASAATCGRRSRPCSRSRSRSSARA